MTVGPQRFQYPKTPDDAARSDHATAHAVHGAGSTDALFKGAPKTITPWPSAGRTKSNPRGYNPEKVNAALANPQAHMRHVDPRDLHATQPWVTQEGVSYYMGHEYRETGRTFADQSVASNKFPVVYSDAQGRNRLLSGHHRATAALLRGEQFHVIHVEE